ncbi:type II secretion system protein GspI [Pseudoalteromonas atlantica]|uniref:Type II secretion system protein I n=1 Tax=Pseudoalteromonas atlantica TaxID=288 RepID=A0ABQ0UHW1_PSEAF|nr:MULTISPECIES: type II secretion system minor pseudopilin GspI [unclassified Pseudoalteromonas]TMO04413.1 type II secretion system protein GspI [Pseudoalteromonas sp. S327]TMO17271.1 type II secretion system protein GspI [Pseudoalteromonas sp. S326]GEK78048.1 type II secretion system protein GspI [Pseudoalteromonas atlantica]
MRLNKGFTLLEVLVALSICAMAGIAAMQATGEHINHLTTLEEQTYASWVAENVLVVQRSKGKDWQAKNGERGSEVMAGVEWFWKQEIAKTADKSFVKVTINVFSDEKYEQSVYELSTYLNKGS